MDASPRSVFTWRVPFSCRMEITIELPCKQSDSKNRYGDLKTQFVSGGTVLYVMHFSE